MTAIKVLIILALLSAASLNAQLAERTSLGLEGANLNSLAATSDAGLVFAGVAGPSGLYFSRDFGANWIFGGGGDYSAGAASGVFVIGSQVYLVQSRGGVIYGAALPEDADTDWSPQWAKLVAAGENPWVTAAGTYLLIANRGNSIAVFATAANSLVAQSNSAPLNHNLKRVAIANGTLYAVSEVAVGGPRETHLFKASFDEADGQIGAYEQIDRAAVGLPLNASIWNMAIAPNGDIFVALENENVYRSTDGAASFQATALDRQFNSYCFQGDTFILGLAASSDAGDSWTDLGHLKVSERGRLEDQSCLINPTNAAQALIGSNRGAFRTDDLSSAQPSFPDAAESFRGLAGVTVKTIAQSDANPDRVLLGTSAGLAFTNSFRAAAPTWTFPICPGGDCVGAERAVIDPSNDNHLYYGSGNIRRGVVSEDGSISWEDFADKPKAEANICVFKMYPFLPNRLIVGLCREHGEQDGGLYWLNTTDKSVQEVAHPDIKDKPISAFIAIDADLFFAAVGGFSDFPDQVDRYLLKSPDGGISWEKISDAELSQTLLARSMVYHEAGDTLYVGTVQNPGINQNPAEPGQVYRLTAAKNGGGDWSAAEPFPSDESGRDGPASVSGLVVDPESGDVYAASWEKIFVSLDRGESWLLFYQGLLNEESFDLSFREAVAEQAFRIQSARSGLTQAAQTGLYGFSGEIPRASCSLRVLAPCRRRVDPGASCRIRAGLLNSINNEGYARVPVRLQINNRKKEEGWRQLARLRTNAKGVRVFRITTPPQGNRRRFYRLLVDSPSCRSAMVSIATRIR